MGLFFTYVCFILFGSFVTYLALLWLMASIVVTYQKIDKATRRLEVAAHDKEDESCHS